MTGERINFIEAPKAYLIEWEVVGEPRSRVQLDTRMEPWFRNYEPKVTPLYTRVALEAFLINEQEIGWAYWNPDTGNKWSCNHPIASGETPDAINVTQMTLAHFKLQFPLNSKNIR